MIFFLLWTVSVYFNTVGLVLDCKNLCHLPANVLFWQKWSEKTLGKLADLHLPRKQS